MAKNRTIPFGYCMKNGEITTEPKEVYAVVTIFDEYLKGRSLSEIAKLMQTEKIRYNAVSDKWNKNMVKRIIENDKYLGNDTYPQLITEDIFKRANEKRVKKSTTINLISDDLQKIRNRTYCTECGHRLSRIGGNSKYEHWDCRNPDCYKLEYRLTDQMIIGAVLTVLNSAIANPSLLESGGEISTYSPTADIVRKQNEINQMTDSSQIDFDRVKAEIFKLAEMKYDCCTYNDSPQKTEKLKELLQGHEQLNSLDIGLFKACVSRIWISHFCTIEVEFINGVHIKNITERNDKNVHSAECNGYTCESADS
ncbi:recombinase family protein [Ruminococcus sp. MSJ-25]|uniref:recombinase family protein n=1 Tax=Ruminococcus sp. MSJ-25 TaxID=2841536 RepID=UPI001C10552D|nr:recombinase family protein [Ruminococcus sp. MSJ-25]MBU5407295.1 recombinase family protein [Ruminococcus sp. MSJ-25]